MSSTSDRLLTLGVIGSGFAARTVVAAALSCEMAGPIMITGGRGIGQLSMLYATQPCASVEELLDAVDAVVITTPHDSHADYAAKALNRGVHVLCEKPFVTRIADGERLIKLAEARALVLSVNHFQRYRTPNSAVAIRLKEDGLRITGGRARLIEGPGKQDWKRNPANRGFLFGYGVHVLDLLLWWLDEPCVEVSGTQLVTDGVEHCTAATLAFRSGCRISVLTSDLGREGIAVSQPGRAILDFELLTDAGLLDVDSYAEAILRTQLGPQALGALGTWEDFDSPVRLEAYRQALEQFLVACRDGVPPELTARDALEAVRICDALEQSARHEGRMTCVL